MPGAKYGPPQWSTSFQSPVGIGLTGLPRGLWVCQAHYLVLIAIFLCFDYLAFDRVVCLDFSKMIRESFAIVFFVTLLVLSSFFMVFKSFDDR